MVLFFIKCTSRKEDIAYPPPICDTSVVRLSVEIKNILTANCLVCHGNDVYASDGGGYQLENYAVISALARGGTLLHAITHDDPDNYVPMPKNASRLSDCDINKFRAWINRGANDN